MDSIHCEFKNEAGFYPLFDLIFYVVAQIQRAAEDNSKDDEDQGDEDCDPEGVGGDPKSGQEDGGEDAEDQTVKWSSNDVGDVFPCAGKFEGFAHAPGFGGNAALDVALFDQWVAVCDLFFTKSSESFLFLIGHISLLCVHKAGATCKGSPISPGGSLL